MSYSYFARYYDAFTDDVPYSRFADYYQRIFNALQVKPQIILDAACGTGSLSVELAKRGYDVIGADISPDMLMIAQNKAYQKNLDILFLCQSMAELDLYGTVDSVVCSLDSINHITEENELIRSLQKIALFLHPDGVFIFDVNSVYKHREVLAGNNFVREKDNVFCVWQNVLCYDNVTVEIKLDFFEKEQKNLYVKTSELFYERAYTDKELQSILFQSGLKVAGRYAAFTFNEPEEKEERIFYIARKI